MDVKEIKSVFSACGFSLDEDKVLLYQRYLRMLRQENKKHNLTRILEPRAILEEHFCDSLAGLFVKPEKEVRLLDLGSGAGFPGVPLKIFVPEIKLYLLEAVRKKIIFLSRLVRELGLKNVTLWQQRAEDLGRSHYRENFTWVTARAVAPLAVILELALPLVQEGGIFCSWQGPKAFWELERAGDILLRCGGKLKNVRSYRLPFCGKKRLIMIFEKVAKTEGRFPRRSGIPQKRPWFNKNI
ncbi:MAG: 16S rRNA (guanine(527)-N(7))-methyltransferase RsmG [Firmicutes bacterium]|nr:16S rRNA (guanine(527)-N(7))-methyltransferase RsmG [Bacillota bacterium]